MKIEQRILNARSKETNINLIAKLGKIQFLRFVYSAKTGEITTSNVGEQHIIPKFCRNAKRKWSSYKGRRANALASEAEEGRGKLRKAAGSGKHTSIRRYPNGAIRRESCPVIVW